MVPGMGDLVELINGWILPVAVSPAIGSFLGVLVRRLPAEKPVVAGRSACEACGHVLRPSEMIPLLSYAAQRGRCRACGARIDPMHPAIELAALAVAGFSAWLVPGGPDLWLTCLLGWWLLALSWIDALHFWLPDALTLPLLLAGLAEAAWRVPAAIYSRALGAMLAYLALWLLATAYRRLRGREGLGMGDAKLLAAGTAWLGPRALPELLILAPLLALFWVLVLRLRGTQLSGTHKLPFGPFLAVAIWVEWLAAHRFWID